MDGRAQQPEDFASAFEAAFARLQVLLEVACGAEAPWSRRVMAAVEQALEFAATEPRAAAVLAADALAQGVDGIERYERLMAYLARLLEPGRAESPHGVDLPPITERSIAGGVAAIIAHRIDRGRARELPSLAREVVQFVLTPYLGTKEARRLAGEVDWPPGQPDR